MTNVITRPIGHFATIFMSRLSPDEVILGLLAHQPAHGYQLLDYFNTHFQYIWRLSTSQLYACLKRLEGLQEIWGQEHPAYDAPTRTEYVLTPLGKNRLQRWLDDPYPSPSTRQIRTQFLSRLHIAQLLEKDRAPIIQAQRMACHQHASHLTALLASVTLATDQLALNLQLTEQHAILEWLLQFEASLQQG